MSYDGRDIRVWSGKSPIAPYESFQQHQQTSNTIGISVSFSFGQLYYYFVDLLMDWGDGRSDGATNVSPTFL